MMNFSEAIAALKRADGQKRGQTLGEQIKLLDREMIDLPALPSAALGYIVRLLADPNNWVEHQLSDIFSLFLTEFDKFTASQKAQLYEAVAAMAKTAERMADIVATAAGEYIARTCSPQISLDLATELVAIGREPSKDVAVSICYFVSADPDATEKQKLFARNIISTL